MAAGRLAVENDGIETDVFDINLFPELREQYKIMSVPCLIYNDKISFGKKNIDELLQLENPYNCPHGRPTIIAMTRTELEKKV